MNVFWPEESGWSVSVSAAITADSGVTGHKPRYHHRHQQQILLQQLSAVRVAALTAQTCTYPGERALERLTLKNMWLSR